MRILKSPIAAHGAAFLFFLAALYSTQGFDSVGPLGWLLSAALQAWGLVAALKVAIEHNALITLAVGASILLYAIAWRKARRIGVDTHQLYGFFGKTVFTGGLALMATKVSSIEQGSSVANTMFSFYGAMAIVFVGYHLIALINFVATAGKICRAPYPDQERETIDRGNPASTLRRKRLLSFAGAFTVILGLVLWIALRAVSVKSVRDPEIDSVEMTESIEEGAASHPELEIVRKIQVSPDFANADEQSSDLSGNLPDGLRFEWEGRHGWEPAFILQARDGDFLNRGRKISAQEASHVYAINGPMIKSDEGEILYFHRDVLVQLNHLFADSPASAYSIVRVSRSGDQVRLKMESSAGLPPRTFVVTL